MNNTENLTNSTKSSSFKNTLTHKVAPVVLALSTLSAPVLTGCREKEVIPADQEYPGEDCIYYAMRGGNVIFTSNHQVSNRDAFIGSDYYYVKMPVTFSGLIVDYRILELKGKLNNANLQALFKQYQYDSIGAPTCWYAFSRDVLTNAGLGYSITTQSMLHYATEKGMTARQKVTIDNKRYDVEYPVAVDKQLSFGKAPKQSTTDASYPSKKALDELNVTFADPELER